MRNRVARRRAQAASCRAAAGIRAHRACGLLRRAGCQQFNLRQRHPARCYQTQAVLAVATGPGDAERPGLASGFEVFAAALVQQRPAAVAAAGLQRPFATADAAVAAGQRVHRRGALGQPGQRDDRATAQADRGTGIVIHQCRQRAAIA
ncbi:hypothetical protein G6F24_016763 [Rhizopus arrhizus]|nr:hypothetical protein G6F24_016763 [Rhizopus arrhizus]